MGSLSSGTEGRGASFDRPICYHFDGVLRLRQTLDRVRFCNSERAVEEGVRRKVTGDSSSRFRFTRMS